MKRIVRQGGYLQRLNRHIEKNIYTWTQKAVPWLAILNVLLTNVDDVKETKFPDHLIYHLSPK
jgi:hypothetical protein